MFGLNHKTFIEHVLDNENEEFQEFYNPSKFSESKTSVTSEGHNSFEAGNVIIEADSSSPSFNNLITRSRIITNRNKLRDNQRPNFYNYDDLMHNVYSEISIVNNIGTFKDAINIINDLHEALGKDLFGVLLIDERPREPVIINPLHPLVALSLVDNQDFLDSTYVYNAVVYTYKNRKNMDDYLESDTADLSIIEENLVNLIQCHSEKKEETAEAVVFDEKTDLGEIEFKYKFQDFGHGVSNNVAHLLIPNQILTYGTYIPWYGTSLVKKFKNGNTSEGMSVSPFFSCNIDYSTDSFRHEFDSKWAIDNHQEVRPVYYSVCVGSGASNTNYKGLRRLTHSNASSAYRSDVITSGSLIYADKCIEKSLEMYKIIGLLKQLTPEEIDEKLRNRPGGYLGIDYSASKTPYTNDFQIDKFMHISERDELKSYILSVIGYSSTNMIKLAKIFVNLMKNDVSLELNNKFIYAGLMDFIYSNLSIKYTGYRRPSYFGSRHGEGFRFLTLADDQVRLRSIGQINSRDDLKDKKIIEFNEFMDMALEKYNIEKDN